MLERKFPIGIQTFSEIIRGIYIHRQNRTCMELSQLFKVRFLDKDYESGKELVPSRSGL